MRVEPRRILCVDYDSLVTSAKQILEDQADFLSLRLVIKAANTFRASQVILWSSSAQTPTVGLLGFLWSPDVPEISDEWPTAVLSGGLSPRLDYQYERVKTFFEPTPSFSDIRERKLSDIERDYGKLLDLIPQMVGIAAHSSLSTGISLVKRTAAGKITRIKKEQELLKYGPDPMLTTVIPYVKTKLSEEQVREIGLGCVIPDVRDLVKYQDNQESLQFFAFTPRDDGFKKYLDEIRESKICAVDTETTGLNVQHHGSDYPIGVSISKDEISGAYIPVNSHDETIESILADPSITKIFHNLKFDAAAIKKLPHYTSLEGKIYDTMIAASLLNYGADDDRFTGKTKSLGLKSLTKRLLGYEMTLIDDLKNKEGKLDLEHTSIGQLASYAGSDALQTLRLWKLFEPELHARGLWELFELEMKTALHLLKMEEHGVYIDIAGIKKARGETGVHLSLLRKKIYETINNEQANSLDIDSSPQLSKILFEILKLRPIKSKTTGFSVDKETLDKIENQHPVIPLLKEYRALRTILNMYFVTIPKNIGSDSRFHTNYGQTKIVTGRLNSRPNLLAIPARGPGKIIRGLFKPQRRGWKYVGCDFSQLEIRIMAHLSQDPVLMDMFLNEEEMEKKGETLDIYRKMGSLILKKPESTITDEERSYVKQFVLGSNYGLTEHGFARKANLSKKEAIEFQEMYFNTLSGVKKYMESAVYDARQRGYARSIMGRRRYLPEIKSEYDVLRAEAERAAINFPVQASAAEIAKIALNSINVMIGMLGLENKAFVVLHVHDEYVVECDSQVVDDIKYIVEDSMRGAGNIIGLSVPLKAKASVGDSWAEIKG